MKLSSDKNRRASFEGEGDVTYQKLLSILKILVLLILAILVNDCGMDDSGSSTTGSPSPASSVSLNQNPAASNTLQGINDQSANLFKSGLSASNSPNPSRTDAAQLTPQSDPKVRLESYKQQVENAGSNAARVLYDGLGDSDPGIRQFAQEWLPILIHENPDVKHDIEAMQEKNVNPSSRSSAVELLNKLENANTSVNSGGATSDDWN
ncbi:MAG: hypothetical protein ACYDBV_02250 [Nitrospiria bacterium]